MPPSQPTIYKRPEWKHDTDGICDGCSMEFSIVRRRHHCRRCGGLFCSDCTKERRVLPAIGYTKPQRVCRGCSGLPLLVCKLQHQECEARAEVSNDWFDKTMDILIQYTSREYPRAMTTAGVQCSLGMETQREPSETLSNNDELTILLTRTSMEEKLGFTVVDMMVKTIEEDTPASRCKLAQCLGMQLTHVNGHFVTSPNDAREKLGACGLSVSLTLRHQDDESLASSGDVVVPHIEPTGIEVRFKSEDGDSHVFREKQGKLSYVRNSIENPHIVRVRYLPKKSGRVLILHPGNITISLPSADCAWPPVVARLHALASHLSVTHPPGPEHNLPAASSKMKSITLQNMKIISETTLKTADVVAGWLHEAISDGEDEKVSA